MTYGAFIYGEASVYGGGPAVTDVYIRPQTCDTIRIYPSQVHPTTPPDSGGGGSRQRPYIVEPRREKRKKKEDDLWVILLHQNLLD